MPGALTCAAAALVGLVSFIALTARGEPPECPLEPLPNIVAVHQPNGSSALFSRTCPSFLEAPGEPDNCSTPAEDIHGERLFFVRELGLGEGEPITSSECAVLFAPSGSPSATPSSTSSPTPSPSATPSVSPSVTPSASPSATPSTTASPTATVSSTPSSSPSPSPSTSASQSPSPSPSPSNQVLVLGGDFYGVGGVRRRFATRWNGLEYLDTTAGLNDVVRCSVVHNGTLFIGGVFTASEATPSGLNRVAKWDGAHWRPLGGGVDAEVTVLHVFDNALIVGGSFLQAGGGMVTRRIARFNLTTGAWSGMGFGLNGTVRALATFNGALYAGCETSAPWSLARWQASTASWAPVGGGVGGAVTALHVFGSALIVGGTFQTVGTGLSARRIASWNGTAWSAMGGGFDRSVIWVTTFGGRLIAAPEYTENGISWWNATSRTWVPFGSGLSASSSLTLVAATPEKLVVVAIVSQHMGTQVRAMQTWDGSSWNDQLTYFSEHISTVVSFEGGLFVGGSLGRLGFPRSQYLAAHSGTALLGVPDMDVRYAVTAIEVDERHVYIGGTTTPSLIRWTPSNGFLQTSFVTGEVFAMHKHREMLYIAGRFTTIRPVRFLKVDSHGFPDSVGIGAEVDNWDFSYFSEVRFVSFGSKLVVGGPIFNSGVPGTYRHVFSFDSDTDTFDSMAGGLPSLARAFAVSSGTLFAGGHFTIGTVSSAIVQWTGSSWLALPPTLDQEVFSVSAMLDLGDRILVSSSLPSGRSATSTWNGTAFTPVGSTSGDFDNDVRSFFVFRGDLYATGHFVDALAKWDSLASRWDFDTPLAIVGRVDAVKVFG